MTHAVAARVVAGAGLLATCWLACGSEVHVVPGPASGAPVNGKPSSDVAPADEPPTDVPPADAPPSTTGLPTASSTSPAQSDLPPLEKRFLPHETGCKADADCGVTAQGLDERLFCCDPCGAVAGTTAWVARADALCSAYKKGTTLHPCPPRDCGPPGAARCIAGQCELSP